MDVITTLRNSLREGAGLSHESISQTVELICMCYDMTVKVIALSKLSEMQFR